MTSALKTYIEAWLAKANSDLLSAQRLLDIEPVILDSACFHCQQAVEKSLKAFLIYNGKDVERTHNVVLLLNECAAFDAQFGSIDPLSLNAYAVHGRYPDANLMPEPDEARELYNLAISIYKLVREKMALL